MPIIRAHHPIKGYNTTTVCNEENRNKTIEELRQKGCTNIHDTETGEKYEDDQRKCHSCGKIPDAFGVCRCCNKDSK